MERGNSVADAADDAPSGVDYGTDDAVGVRGMERSRLPTVSRDGGDHVALEGQARRVADAVRLCEGGVCKRVEEDGAVDQVSMDDERNMTR